MMLYTEIMSIEVKEKHYQSISLLDSGIRKTDF